MVRFCTEKYDASDLTERYAHLTNFAVNKHNANFSQRHKRYLSEVLKEMEKNGANAEKIQRGIDRIVMMTVMAAQPHLAASYYMSFNVNDGKSRCFEILGFDILIDENKRPWLLEVNCMPSFQCGSTLDYELKHQVIMDALIVVDIPISFRRDCMAWYRTMSVHRSPQQLFDPARESEVARKTGWRQLFPLLDERSAEVPNCQLVADYLRAKVEARVPVMRKLNQNMPKTGALGALIQRLPQSPKVSRHLQQEQVNIGLPGGKPAARSATKREKRSESLSTPVKVSNGFQNDLVRPETPKYAGREKTESVRRNHVRDAKPTIVQPQRVDVQVHVRDSQSKQGYVVNQPVKAPEGVAKDVPRNGQVDIKFSRVMTPLVPNEGPPRSNGAVRNEVKVRPPSSDAHGDGRLGQRVLGMAREIKEVTPANNVVFAAWGFAPVLFLEPEEVDRVKGIKNRENMSVNLGVHKQVCRFLEMADVRELVKVKRPSHALFPMGKVE
jgi:hypothetical protein